MATFEIANIGNAAFKSEWYKYPANVHKYLVLIMARSQNPVYFTGQNLFRCTLEIFMKVKALVLHLKKSSHFTKLLQFQFNRSAASYYLMFRNLSELK